MDEHELETRLTDTPAPDALDRWGPFEHLHRVGRGSFGEVYRAFDPTLQRHVALKLLLPGRLNRDDEASALLREARAIARVRHPNVVPIYGVDRHEGRVGFWSDFVKGQTLSELVAIQGAMGPREAALIGIDVCRAAGAVHAAGFLHRDIKAGNVMREEGGRILLMDFGLTHEHGTDEDASGTPAYMAPELMLGHAASVASDVYAIGVMLFYLLTRQYPVEGATVAELRAAHASARRRTLLDVRPDLPEALARVVEPAISPAPEKRFASTGQMIAALSEAIGLGASTVPAPAIVKPRRLRPWMFAPAVLAAALLLVAFIDRAGACHRVADTGARGGSKRTIGARTTCWRITTGRRRSKRRFRCSRRSSSQDPKFAPAFADLGRANFLQFSQQRDTKYIEPAREASLRALALAPGLASAHVTLGFLYAFTDQNDLASQELDEALRLDKFNAAAYGALAELQDRQGRTELVEATLQKAVTLAPDDWLLNSQLGAHYLDRGMWEKAGEQFRHAVDLVPDNPRAYNNLGLVYRGLGKLDDRRGSFSESNRPGANVRSLPEPGHGAGGSRKVRPGGAGTPTIDRMRPNQYRAWGILASVYASQHADAAKIKRDVSQGDRPRRRPPEADAEGRVSPRRCRRLLRRGRNGEEKRAAARASCGTRAGNPEVLYQVAVGYELVATVTRPSVILLKRKPAATLPRRLRRNPLLESLRSDPRYRFERRRESLTPSTKGEMSMTNPNVDRAPAPKKKAKKTKKS